MIGPSVILAGLSIGSGELILWPRLTAEWGTLGCACVFFGYFSVLTLVDRIGGGG